MARDSQNDLILAHLKSGRTLTSLEALSLYRCFRLASRISDLRLTLGHPEIEKRTVTNPAGDKKIAEYFIPRPVVQP